MTDSVIFLDIDGVLNGHEWDQDVMCGEIHRDKVHLLNVVLRKTGAKIVLSSAWRYIVHRGEMNLMGMEWLLRSHGMLANRLISITQLDTMVREVFRGDLKTWPMLDERGAQVSAWRAANEHMGRYVVLDDLDLGFTAAGHPLVKTNSEEGLTAANVVALISALNG